jgi:hypothetical protein
MSETSESLTSEQEFVLSEVEEMVLSAISARCADCSNAKFTPNRIARAVASGTISEVLAKEVAVRFANCAGLKDGICHYPPPPE